MSAPLREGDILAGKYKIEKVLAQGGMGVVVAAMHQQLEQRVALKFLLPEGMANEASLGRFMREAKAAVRLRSEHVARVLDVGTADTGAAYIVMEYLEGQDLSASLEKEGRLPVAMAVTYVLQAAEAVAEAHALGIVHRDLKPANLFLTKRPDGTPCVKVLDFGISKVTQGPDMNLTKASAVMGTPYYMAPEQLKSSKAVDRRSDIWSIGMILYELLTGSVAFERDTLPELCSAVLFEPVPPPRSRCPSLPEALEAVILRALEKAPEDRYQSLAQLATDLAPFAPEGEQLAMRVRRVLGESARPSESPPPEPHAPPRESAPASVAIAPSLDAVEAAEPAPLVPQRRVPVPLLIGLAAVVVLALAVTAIARLAAPSANAKTGSEPPKPVVRAPDPPSPTTSAAPPDVPVTASGAIMVAPSTPLPAAQPSIAAAVRPKTASPAAKGAASATAPGAKATNGDIVDLYGTRK